MLLKPWLHESLMANSAGYGFCLTNCKAGDIIEVWSKKTTETEWTKATETTCSSNDYNTVRVTKSLLSPSTLYDIRINRKDGTDESEWLEFTAFTAQTPSFSASSPGNNRMALSVSTAQNPFCLCLIGQPSNSSYGGLIGTKTGTYYLESLSLGYSQAGCYGVYNAPDVIPLLTAYTNGRSLQITGESSETHERPSNLQVIPTNDKHRISWTGVDGALSYKVLIAPTTTRGNVHESTSNINRPIWTYEITTTETSVETTLQACVFYAFAILAYFEKPTCTGLFNYNSNRIGTFITPKPSGLNAVKINDSSYKIEWLSQPTYKYLIKYKPSSGANWEEILVDPSGEDKETLVLQNLTPDIKYDYSIEAIGDGKIYINSPPAESSFGFSKLSTPTGLYADNITSDSARVSWTAVENASGYKVEYRRQGDTTWNE